MLVHGTPTHSVFVNQRPQYSLGLFERCLLLQIPVIAHEWLCSVLANRKNVKVLVLASEDAADQILLYEYIPC